MNDFFNHDTQLLPGKRAKSSDVNNRFKDVEAGFDKLPDLSTLESAAKVSNATSSGRYYMFTGPDNEGQSITGSELRENIGAVNSSDIASGSLPAEFTTLTVQQDYLTTGTGKVKGQVSYDVTYTVGAGGDYATLNEALEDLGGRAVAYQNGGITVTLQLMSGFVMNERVNVVGLDLGWITITSIDSTVNIDPSAVAGTSDPVFEIKNGTLPIVDVKFSGSGAGSSNAFMRVSENGRAVIKTSKGFTCTDSTYWYAFHVREEGTLILEGYTFANSGVAGIYVDGGYVRNLGSEVFSNSPTALSVTNKGGVYLHKLTVAGGKGIVAMRGAKVVVNTLSGSSMTSHIVEATDGSEVDVIGNSLMQTSGDVGVLADSGSKVKFHAGDVRAAVAELKVSKGSIIVANDLIFNVASQAVNTITADGIIFSSY